LLFLKQIILCFQFLTRLPLPSFVSSSSEKLSLAAAAWCFPLVGAFIGGLLWGFLLALDGLNVPFYLQCVAVLVLGICLTGALHEDGFADFFDGLGVYDRARALEVMRDSQVGSFGALALLVSFAWRGVALFELGSVHLVGLSLLLAHIGSRGFMGALLLLPRARSDGLAVSSGVVSWISVLFALAFCAIVFFSLLPWYVVFLVFLISGAGVLIVSLIALRRYGGLTGDIYGAGQQVSEMLMLFVLASVLPELI
jgi:adenosylcobinamide-GDP ribazoletransferase